MAQRFMKMPSNIVFALSGALLLGSPALAQEGAPAAPETVLRFSGAGGATPGASIWTAPVYRPEDGRLYGFTQAGGDRYPYQASFGAVEVDSGRGFGVAPDGSGYVSWSLGGAGGSPLTNVVLDSLGRAVTAGQNALRDDSGAPTAPGFRIVGASGDGLTWFERPSADIVDAVANVSPRGTLAADDQGNVYFGMGSAQTCNATNTDRSLYRRTPEGAIQAVVDFCDFSELRSGTTRSFLKGGAPFINLYSTRDQALYILSPLSAQNTPALYPEIVSGTDRVTGFLVRIGREALDRGTVTGDDIEVLRAFKDSETNGTVAVATDTGRSALVEDGDWLYGTGGAIVWRLNKQDPQNSFSIVHVFKSASAAEELTDVEAGAKPMGDMVLARDGNLYGVTETDVTSVTGAGRAAGAGSLFRVVTGSAADRSDDRIEFLHYFDGASEGSSPVGLSAGPAGEGRQWLYGATRSGLDGSGGIFRFAVAVPEVVITSFEAASTTLRVGQAPTLSWTTEQASACLASGDWSGDKGALGEETLPAIQAAGTYTYALQCSGPGGSSIVEEVVIRVNAAEGGVETGSGGGGAAGAGMLFALALLGLARRRIVKR